MIRLVAVLLALVAIGCAAPAGVAFRGDERFAARERADIDAANAWEAKMLGVDPVEIEWVHLGGGPCRDAIVIRDLPTGTLGETSDEGCMSIDREQGADRLGVVFAHELGHVRGLGHHAEPGLMNPFVPPALEWSPADADAWARTPR